MEHLRSSSESADWLSRFSNYMKERRYKRMWNALHKIFTRVKKRFGIKTSFTLHCLRHCYATHLLEAGTDLHYIQELLRHKHSTTTEIYTHVSTRNIQQIKSPFDDLEI